jgi:tetratricopeptide (TPR) repeat protein
VAVLNNLALVCKERGAMERACVLTETALALCVSQGDLHREAALHNNLADLLHTLGRHEDAMSHLKQAVTIYAEIGVEAGMVQPEIWKLAEW